MHVYDVREEVLQIEKRPLYRLFWGEVGAGHASFDE
jgi:hypothetical protein